MLLNDRVAIATKLVRFAVITLPIVAFMSCLNLLSAGEAESAFKRLAERYDRQREEFQDAFFSAKTDEERERADRKLNPANVLLDVFFEMEASHRKSRVGLSALRHILLETRPRVDSEPAVEKIKARRRALKILRQDYWSNPNLDYVIKILDPASKVSEEQSVLNAAADHRDRQIRAVALWNRAMGKRSEAPVSRG